RNTNIDVFITVPSGVGIVTTTLTDWTVNKSGYSQTIVTSGGTTPITFAVTVGTLPSGLTLNTSTGVISGTPTASRAATFTITATDALSASANRAYTVTINPAVAITTTTLADWTVNLAGYSQTVSATGGTGAKTFAVTTGTLPAGLTLNTTTGVISG